MSVKFQITLPDDLAVALKRAAAQEKVPLAELIRQTMEAHLRDRRRRNARKPLGAITGILDTNETDLAARVDEILY
jgi:metal-responsive CopG/Arc/MetJ family transcriptional regulator